MDEMFITCILDIVDLKRELSPQAVIQLVEEKFTSTNRPITSSAKCSFCGAESAIMFPVCSTCRGNMPG